MGLALGLCDLALAIGGETGLQRRGRRETLTLGEILDAVTDALALRFGDLGQVLVEGVDALRVVPRQLRLNLADGRSAIPVDVVLVIAILARTPDAIATAGHR